MTERLVRVSTSRNVKPSEARLAQVIAQGVPQTDRRSRAGGTGVLDISTSYASID